MHARPHLTGDPLARLRLLLREHRPGPDRTGADTNALLDSLAAADAAPARTAEALELLARTGLDQLCGESVALDALAAVGARLQRLAPGDGELHRAARAWLDLVRRAPVPALIAARGAVAEWWELILGNIDASEFTVGALFAQRAASYGPRPLFIVPSLGDGGVYSWNEVAASVDQVARGLLALQDETGNRPIAVLSENRYEMALLDLACLTTGIVDVMIPATATGNEVEFILAECECAVVVVSGEAQLKKVPRGGRGVPQLKLVLTFDPLDRALQGVRPFREIVAGARAVSPAQLARRREAVRLQDLATIMYTSGTTGQPKGIRFSGRNLVSKRFARGLAIPALGDRDVFLSFLPLYHTFGRYLEMLGCVHWGATYVFQESPAIEQLVQNIRRYQPSVFISIPKKWMELYEEIGRRADLDAASPGEVRDAARAVVGERMRWGLSAAGYLSPEVFRFFQRQGVELLSGFGMTEATGGITMTPPGQYRDDSLGLPLPGIEVRLDEDNELMIRGPYVMLGYVGPPDEAGLDAEGWLRTGDLLERDEAGHLRFVDRKKEIYKSLRGQTITPQKIENMFRDFESVRRVFVVGDHREYNTALIVPNLDARGAGLREMGQEKLRAHYRLLVSSVNRFLGPHERLLDFALVDRDFSPERGELTPKNTYRRRVVAENFAELIAGLYRRAWLRLPGLTAAVRMPNWLFQASGVTAEELRVEGNCLVLGDGPRLHVEEVARGETHVDVRLGDVVYRVRGRAIDLGVLLSTPALWVGNRELVRFLELDPAARARRRRRPADLERRQRFAPFVPGAADRDVLRRGRQAPGLHEVDLAACCLVADDEESALLALELLRGALAGPDGGIAELALHALRQAAQAPSAVVRRRAFHLLFPAELDGEAADSLRLFCAADPALLDRETIDRFCDSELSDVKLQALVDHAHALAWQAGGPPAAPWIDLLAGYGARHPSRYRRLRRALAWIEVFGREQYDRERARGARERLVTALRAWIGSSMNVAVDPESGQEYRTDDVVVFAGEVAEHERRLLLEAFARTSVITESLFVLTRGRLVRLADIAPRRLHVSALGERPGKAVFRASVQTRYQGTFDLALNVARGITPEQMRDEVLLLLVTSEPSDGERLVEEFGGTWPEYGLWSEEFVAGENLEQLVERLATHAGPTWQARLASLWPSLVWGACWAHIDFWRRTGYRYVIGEPTPAGVIVPTHDYQVGTRIVSLAGRKPFESLRSLLRALWDGLVVPVEERVPLLRGAATPELALAALLEVVGVVHGISLLESVAREDAGWAGAIREYLADVRRAGFVPMRARFAIDRYRRWAALAPESTREARARTVLELYDTYDIATLARRYPSVRLRVFRDTVLAGASDALQRGLDEILALSATRPLEPRELLERLIALRAVVDEGSDEAYFLARLTYPHLRPRDTALIASTPIGGERQPDVVLTLTDHEGRPFLLRQPVSPREVDRLHQLFEAAHLPVTFTAENLFLVAVSERGELAGGLFYELDVEAGEAYLDKIVVAERHRGQGIGEGLMEEFMNRMRTLGVRQVRTGFFRPEFFRRFGFAIDSRHAGQVRRLGEED
ncbi:MAG: GNAT family N-acetyltransferase [Acidobacteria bacterium]|nr:GNAT family N-acetyltransferase [Acidobacteriota bacterium]